MSEKIEDNQDKNDSHHQVEALGQGRELFSPLNNYRLIGQYQKQDVYFNPMDSHILIEKDNSYLVEPDVDERKGLIDSGLVTIVDDMQILTPKHDDKM